MSNVDLVRLERVAPFRKVAIGTWATTYDPTVYGTMRVRMEEAEAYIEAFRAQKGKRLTVTHLVTAAVGKALKQCPEANAIIRWNRIYLRQHVDVSVLVVVPTDDGSKVDLSAAMLRDVDAMTLSDQIDALDAQVGGIRSGADKAMKKAKSDIMKIPFLAMNAFLKLIAFLLYDLNLDLRAIGFPKTRSAARRSRTWARSASTSRTSRSFPTRAYRSSWHRASCATKPSWTMARWFPGA